ncbi:MAG: hypothetical protein ACREH9_07240, partial [Pseudomonadota bacterium]
DTQGQTAVNLDSTPTLRGNGGQTAAIPAGSGVVVSSLNPDTAAEVPTPTVTDYMNRAGNFLVDSARQDASKVALSGKTFAEEEMGPYGMTAVVMVNIARLPRWEFSQISAAARGDLSPEDANGLTVQATNRIFDFGAPANDAIRNGAMQAGIGQIEDNATEGVATLATSFLPIEDAAKDSIAETAPKLADSLKKVATFWTNSPDTDE